MRRRKLMLVMGGAMTAARALCAQQKAMPVIGVLNSTSPRPFAPSLAGFRQGLGETGYVEGQNVFFEYRWAEGSYDRLPALAADLVGRNVDVILTGSVSACASWRIPVVMGYAPGCFRGMKRDAVPGMSINGGQASV